MTTRDDLVRLIAVCEKASHSPGTVLLDPVAVLPVLRAIASALEAKDAEIATKDKVLTEQAQATYDWMKRATAAESRITSLERQLAEETERCAEVADCMADEYDAVSFTSTNAEQVAALRSKEQAAHDIADAIRGGAK